MSPDDPSPPADAETPLLTRRRLLALAGVGGAALVGTGLVAPEWLPDPVTDAATTAYPDPPTNSVWRPPVSEDHADEAVAALEDAVERAGELRARVDVDAVDDDDVRIHLDGPSAGGHLESAKKERRSNRERLFSATYGMQFAGEAIGYAQVALGEADPDARLERGRELRSRADAVADAVSAYRVSDAGRDLAFLYAVERQLSFARLNTHWSGVYTGGDPDAIDEYSPHGYAETWGSQLQAEQRVRNARHYREQYRDALGATPAVHRDVLRDALDTFLTRLDEYPTRDEMRTTLDDELELTQETPYGAARWELFTLCYDNDFRFFADDFRSDLTVLRAVGTGQALLARQAHDVALKELGVSPDDTDYDSGRSFRAKRRAMREFRAARSEYDSNVAGVVSGAAATLIRGGDVGLAGRFDDDKPAWYERVESAVYSLVGLGMMRNLGDVVDPLVAGE